MDEITSAPFYNEDKDTSSPSIGLVLEESEAKYCQQRSRKTEKKPSEPYLVLLPQTQIAACSFPEELCQNERHTVHTSKCIAVCLSNG